MCLKAASIFTSRRSPSNWRDIRIKNNDTNKDLGRSIPKKIWENSDSGQSSVKHVKEVRKQCVESVGSRYEQTVALYPLHKTVLMVR